MNTYNKLNKILFALAACTSFFTQGSKVMAMQRLIPTRAAATTSLKTMMRKLSIGHNPSPETLSIFAKQHLVYTPQLMRGIAFDEEDFAKLKILKPEDFNQKTLAAFIQEALQDPKIRERSERFGGYINDLSKMPAMDIRFVSKKMGYGAFAIRAIPAGSFVGEYTGAVHSLPSTRPSGGKWYDDSYTTEYPLLERIDAHLCGNETRYMNHSTKEANLELLMLIGNDGIPHLCLFAIRDIQDGEQLLWNYGSDYWTVPYKNILKMLASIAFIHWMTKETPTQQKPKENDDE